MMRQCGFTLVELVITLVIIGILSVAALGLFANRADFTPFTARESLISASLLAQQRALAHQQTTAVTLTVSQFPDHWILQVAQGALAFEAHRVERASATLRVDGTVLSDGDQTDVVYDSRGRTDGERCFEFSSATASPLGVCVSSEGFAHDCSCP